MRRWDDSQYEVLFRDNPPTEPLAPTTDECAALGRSLGRTPKAIRSQWDDGRSLVLGQVNDAASGLRDYLMRRGCI
jgi:hypothetical protein